MPDQYAYTRMVEKCNEIAALINSQYTRGQDGRLYPRFRVPACDMAFVEVYREMFDEKTEQVILNKKWLRENKAKTHLFDIVPQVGA